MPKEYKAKLTVEIPEEDHIYLRNLHHGLKAAVFRQFVSYLIETHKKEGGEMAVNAIASGIVYIETVVGDTLRKGEGEDI